MRPLSILRAMRPHQWVKNVFVLAAVVFARGDQTVEHPEGFADLWSSLLAFAAFCLGSSTIYLINDIMDIESDRAHPEKKHRPIASGELSVPAAIGAAIVCVVASLTLGVLASTDLAVAGVVAAYLALNFTYSVKLKHIVLVDAFCIAAGFLLRVEAGGRAADYTVSYWLIEAFPALALIG